MTTGRHQHPSSATGSSSRYTSHHQNPTTATATERPDQTIDLSTVGALVHIKTSWESYTGYIYAFDIVAGIVIIQGASIAASAVKESQTPPQPPGLSSTDHHPLKKNSSKHTFHVINTKSILSIERVMNRTEEDGVDPIKSNSSDLTSLSHLIPVLPVDMERVNARESAALRVEAERIARIGVNVTREAQDIFDALSKTLPTYWAGPSIIVLDEVSIAPPYSVREAVLIRPGTNANGNHALARVKRVLEGERKRLGLN